MESAKQGSPEHWLNRLLAQLRSHVLRDSILLFLPPLLVGFYVAGYLYRSGWIPEPTFVATSLSVALLALTAMAARYRPYRPSLRAAAHLMDEKTAAKDRFVTLATIEPASCSTTFLSRLRHEASDILARVELRRDFPYQFKTPFYKSLIGSILVVVLFHLFLPFLQARTSPLSAPEKLRALAEKMAERPPLTDLARNLRSLATQLQDPTVSPKDKQAFVQETQKKVEEQQQREDQKDNRDLLGEAASTLRGLERQQGNGQDEQKDQNQGGGGVQSNLPQEGKGEGKPNPGSGGDSQGELSAQLSKEMQQGKSAGGEPQEQASQKNQQRQGDGKSNQPDRQEPDRDRQKEPAGKNPSGQGEKSGKSKASEEIPQGGPPADRFYQPGEQGNVGIKGAGYVTVQLPEEIAAGSKGTTSGTKESRSNSSRAKVPVSNVPLPAHVPGAPMEKQQMPLEYRGIIR